MGDAGFETRDEGCGITDEELVDRGKSHLYSALLLCTALERRWHTQDSQGQILVMAFGHKSLTCCKSFPLGSVLGWY